MKAPEALLQRLQGVEGMATGERRLVLLFSQLGDFDSLEYAQALVAAMPQLQRAGLHLLAIGIGDDDSADRFCAFTGFPRSCLQVEGDNRLHLALGLYQGLQAPGGPWPNLLLMCAGIGSPGTLQEVLRGYSGDRRAPAIFGDDETVKAWPLPAFPGALFARAGGRDFQRPFELATLRLRNMGEVLSHWRTYVPVDDHIAQRGATYLIDAEGQLLYCHREDHLLGFADDMAQPLAFLEPYL